MLFYNKFVSLPKSKQILVVVWGFHFLVVFSLCILHLFEKEKPKTRMVVRTTAAPSFIASQSNAIRQNNSKPSTKRVVEKKMVKPVASAPKKHEAKPILGEVSAKKGTDVGKVESSGLVALQEMERQFASLEKAPASNISSKSLSLPKSLQPLSKTEVCDLKDVEYREILVAFLGSSLDLPELGEVVVDLDIDSKGCLLRFAILDAKSKKNGEFLKKRLPELILPCFNDDNRSYAVRNFTITFKNAPSS